MAERQYMTPKKADIVALHYLENGCIWKSFLAAGFPESWAKRQGFSMFNRPLVQAARERLDVAADKITGDLTLEKVVEGFMAMAWPPDGKDVSNADRNYALDKLAKIKGGYVDRLEIDVPGLGNVPTEEQLRRWDAMAGMAMKEMIATPRKIVENTLNEDGN